VSPKRADPDVLFERLRRIVAALPEAEAARTHGHGAFSVRGKKFGYYLVDHHGDGVIGISVRAAPGEQERLIATDPARFYRPAYSGAHGWVGLRLDTPRVDWGEAERLLVDAYQLAAPRRLAAQFAAR